MAAAVVAVILISVLAAPTVARTTLAEAQARATGAAAVADDGASTNQDAGTSTTHAFQPFTGTPAAIPGTIEAENYDTGGQGFAWFDRTPGNQGGAYRQDDVDIENGGSGHVVAFVKSSEWLIYSVEIAEAGTYTATFRASSPWADREVWVWVDGVLKARVGVSDTGSFDTYENATADLTLPAGSHYIRLQFFRDAQNLDFFSLERAGGPTVTPTPTPTGNVTVTPTPGEGGGSNVTPSPTPTVTGNVTPTPTVNVTDLTNQNSPEAAFLVGNASTTVLQAPTVPIGLQRIAGNFISPLFVADAKDGSDRLFVVDQTGYVKIVYTNGTVIDQPFLDVRDRMVDLLPGYDERGLLSIAFHPNFSTNGKVYAYYSAPLRAGADPSWNCTNRLSEFTVNASDPNLADNATERILLEVDKPSMNHNGGILLFGPTDNYLYLTLGDGGRADDTGIGHTPDIGNAQDLTKLLGKIIRIDVDTTSAGKQYGIPADNPFLSNATIPPEIYAYGFRNPAFATFDSGGSNRMFIAMAGQNLFESVLVLYRGGAYPWNIREGTHCFDPASDRTVANTTCRITSYAGQPLIGPVVELGHDVGNTVVGGVVYRGSNLSALQGAYLFGTWSDSFAAGNGTLLVATPPAGLDTATLPADAASLTPAENAMWTTSEMTVANNPNGRINAFVRGLFASTDGEALVLINQNPGPGVSPQNSGEVWQVVDANTSGLVPTGSAGATPTATPTATSTTAATATATTTPGLTTSVDLTARNLAFSQSTITAQAGALVTIAFNNMDSGVPHNFALYTDASASTAIFTGALVTGPATTTYTFTAPSTPGSYFFRCDVHPTTMTGTFIVT
ncbi:MAG: PQQ-dependent sugar dehydrogenase [Methanospirillum sp.]